MENPHAAAGPAQPKEKAVRTTPKTKDARGQQEMGEQELLQRDNQLARALDLLTGVNLLKAARR